MVDQTLPPCPWCRAPLLLPLLFRQVHASVQQMCGRCGAGGPMCHSEEQATKAWIALHPRPEIPCGNCEVGIYSVEATATPLADKLRALPPDQRKPPSCKRYARPCVGAEAFIAAIGYEEAPHA